MKNMTRRTALAALTGAATSTGALAATKSNEPDDTCEIERLIADHAAKWDQQERALDTLEAAETARSQRPSNSEPILIKVSASTHLDINQLPLDVCQNTVTRMYAETAHLINKTLEGGAKTAALKTLEKQKCKALEDLAAGCAELENEPLQVAVRDAEVQVDQSVDAAEKAGEAILAYVCRNNSELALKHQWFSNHSFYSKIGDEPMTESRELKALADAYFGQIIG